MFFDIFCNEFHGYVSLNKELLLQPLVIARNALEKTKIEGSINSVRISIKIKQSDEMEQVLVDRFSRFLCQRADEFVILRRKPCKVVLFYDLNFSKFSGLRRIFPHHKLQPGNLEER